MQISDRSNRTAFLLGIAAAIIFIFYGVVAWNYLRRPADAWGFINAKGEFVIDPRYNRSGEFCEGVAVVNTCNIVNRYRYQFITPTGKRLAEVGDPVFPGKIFSQGLVVTSTSTPVLYSDDVFDGNYGYLNKAGSWAIAPRFLQAEMFSQGLAAVKIGGKWGENGKWGYISKTGKVVIKPHFKECGYFTEDVAAVRLDGRYGYLNRDGYFVIKPRFDSASWFSEGLAAVKLGKRYGYIDHSGRFVIKPRFKYAHMFSYGRAAVVENGKYGLIDKRGHWIRKPEFDDIVTDDYLPWTKGTFAQGFAAASVKGKYGLINRDGKVVTKPSFDKAGIYREGLLPIKMSGKWGYANVRGEIVIQPQFDRAYSFHGGRALVNVKRPDFQLFRRHP